MAYTVTRLPNEPIVVIKVAHPLDQDVDREAEASDRAVDAAAQDIKGRYFRIADMQALEMSFFQIASWLATQRYQRPGSITDPRIRTVTVAGTQTAQQAAEWAKQQQYGSVNIQIFETMEEALAYARKEVTEGKL